MSKAMKIWLVTGAVLMVLGVMLLVGALAADGWDITKLSTVKYETNTYEVSGDFNNISVSTDISKVTLVPSNEEKCRVVCYEQQNMKHSVTIQNGTLTVETVDTRKWYEHIGVMLGSPHITVYLPKNEYSSLCIETHTGNISLHRELTFESMDISGTTANVQCFSSVSGMTKIRLTTGNIDISGVSMGDTDLSVSTGIIGLESAECGKVSVSVTTGKAGLRDVSCKSVSSNGTTGRVTLNNVTADEGFEIKRSTGDVRLYSVKCGGDIRVSVTTGETELRDVSCKSVTSTGTTGRIVMDNVIASGRFDIDRSTGSVTFEKCDAAEIYVKTDTGSVKGSLLSDKIFIVDTDTGSVSVPKTTTGGRCEISTDTGDIKISIQN